jgi:heme exporter protein C
MTNRLWRALGPVTLISLIATVWLGLWVTPPAQQQGDFARLVYIHPAEAWVGIYLSFGTAVIASGLYLWPRTRRASVDLVAAASMEVSVVFLLLTLITGSIWGRPTWGVWWAWDARLTSTAVMAVLAIGYLAYRASFDDPQRRAQRSAILALISAINVPIIHFSVVWWKTLHQGATVLTPGASIKIHGIMAWTMLLSFIAFTLCFVWMTRVRYSIARGAQVAADARLEAAIAARQSEGAA